MDVSGLEPDERSRLHTGRHAPWLLFQLMENLSEHIKEEENDDLPKLEAALSEEDSESYAKSFGRTKMFVPSRSHPSAPDKPPYETAVGLLAAPIDHLADLFRKWPDSAGMPNPSTEWAWADVSASLVIGLVLLSNFSVSFLARSTCNYL